MNKMKRLQCEILFYDKIWATVYTVKPYKEVMIEGTNEKVDSEFLPDSYYAITEDNDSEEPELIKKDEDPIKFIYYLYHGLSGSYFRATKAKLIDSDVLHKKDEEEQEG